MFKSCKNETKQNKNLILFAILDVVMAAFNGNLKKFNPRPPEKGSFPLDHLNECTEAKNVYMKCLLENDKKIEPCRSLSLAYLNCRMDNQLMARESNERLGFSDLKKEESDTTDEKKKS